MKNLDKLTLEELDELEAHLINEQLEHYDKLETEVCKVSRQAITKAIVINYQKMMDLRHHRNTIYGLTSVVD